MELFFKYSQALKLLREKDRILQDAILGAILKCNIVHFNNDYFKIMKKEKTKTHETVDMSETAPQIMDIHYSHKSSIGNAPFQCKNKRTLPASEYFGIQCKH